MHLVGTVLAKAILVLSEVLAGVYVLFIRALRRDPGKLFGLGESAGGAHRIVLTRSLRHHHGLGGALSIRPINLMAGVVVFLHYC